MVATNLGYTPSAPPESMQEIFDAGKDWEGVVEEKLRARGCEITHELEGHAVDEGQVYVKLGIGDFAVVTGHLDGIILDPVSINPLQRVLETKSFSEDQFKILVDKGWDMPGLMQKYKWQVSPYMIATGLELMFVGSERGSDPVKLHILYQELPFHSLEEITTKILEAEAHDVLPDKCDDRSYPCPFFYLGMCEVERGEASEKMKQLSGRALQLNAMMAPMEKELKIVRAELLKEMGKETSVQTDDATITVQAKTSNVLKAETLKALLGLDSLDAFYEKKKGANYVRVTPRGPRVPSPGVGLDAAPESG